ncbi:MAG: helix-turn-helix domain-containing protein [Candidatus Hodarchaeales archaeon]
MDSYNFSVLEVVKRYSFSRSWIYKLQKRYKEDGMEGLLVEGIEILQGNPRSSSIKRGSTI